MSRSSSSASGVTAVKRARAELEAQDARAHAARIAKLSAIPVIGWLSFLPLDFILTALMYPASMGVVVSVRASVGVLLFGMQRLIQKRPPQTAHAVDMLLSAMMAILCGAIGVIACYSGGLASVHGAGAMIVMSAPSFVELPYRRGARVAFVGWLGFLITTIVTQGARGLLHSELVDPRISVVYGGYLLLLFAMGTIAVAGGHLGHRLRQQVYESRSIGRYKLKKLLGRGGMGEVWAAYHQGLRRDVALKILRDAGPRSVSRFEREVQALADLRHPNTVRVFDYGATDDGLLYYAMELLAGVDLAELVRKSGPLPPGRAVHLLLQAARALAEAHDKGMVHRDMKPENLFIANAGGEVDFVKVLDFGIVRLEKEGTETLTQQGQLAGTPAFMAPEVGRGSDADTRSDVYSLGAVLYCLLTGAPPFDGKGSAAMIAAHQSEPVVPPSLRMTSELPVDVEAVVLACLAKDPDVRPRDAGALADALAATDVARRWRPEEGTAEPESLSTQVGEPFTSSEGDSSDQKTRRLARP
ncbi:MAG: protein kinase [Polyangiaceae bacterium]|nr:protein kinase [Polyangiaceae bacterium]